MKTIDALKFPGILGVAIGILVTVTTFSALAQSDQYNRTLSVYQSQDFRAAESSWKKLAKKGDIHAQYALGVMELRGETANSSPAGAFRWFRKAAKNGHPTAMFNLGVAFWEGTGVKKNRKKALKWWKRSALAGDSGAQFNLGLAYYIGEEQPVDMDLAERWIGMAADQNHPEAQRIYKILLQNSSQSASVPEPGVTVEESVEKPPTPDLTTDSTEQIASFSQQPPAPTVIERPYWKTAGVVNLHTEGKSSSATFYVIPAGIPVEVLDDNGGWNRITLPDGLKMWVFEKYLRVNGDNGVVAGTGVRVRPKPSTDNASSPPVGAYRNGDLVTILDHQGQWYMIRAPKHVGGWVKSEQLTSYMDSEENREALWNEMIAKGL